MVNVRSLDPTFNKLYNLNQKKQNSIHAKQHEQRQKIRRASNETYANDKSTNYLLRRLENDFNDAFNELTV